MFHCWQKFLDSAVNKYSHTSGYEEFCEAKTNEEYIRNVIDNNLLADAEWLEDYFTSIPCKTSQKFKKNKTVADNYREEGNGYFKKHNDAQALASYNECVAHAPLTEECGQNSSLALGLANRSAVLFHLHKYRKCVEDIEKAIEAGYPAHLEHKLWMRKAQCLYHLRDVTLAEAALQWTSKKIHLAKDLTNKQKEKLESNVDVWMQKLHSPCENNISEDSEKCQFLLPELSFGPGAVLRQASAALSVRLSPEKGRYIVANRAIKAGDTLIRERPYAAVLLPGHYRTHCHHCYGKLSVCTPCGRCNRVRYCSAACRDQSWSGYHWLECNFLDLLHSVGIAHLSMRVILVTGIRHILETFLYSDLIETRQAVDTDRPTEGGDSILGVNAQGTYDSDYTAVYHLMPHTEHMEKEDLLQYALTSVLLLRCLREGGFFRRDRVKSRPHNKSVDSELLTCTTNLSLNSDKPNVDLENGINLRQSGVEELVGALLLRHICQLICNAHAITELQVKQVTHVDTANLVNPQSQVRIATALYPTTSLCNHACEPSFINSFHRDILIVRSVKNISPGEEICNCYGPQYRRMTRNERRQLLRDQYFFDCHCKACEEGERTEQRHQALRCPECAGAVGPLPDAVCLDCGAAVRDTDALLKHVLTARDLFGRGLQLMDSEDISDAVAVLRKCLKLRRTVLYQHHRDVAEANDALARCYATYGDFARSAEHIAESVTTTEVIYGSKSIELANELHKFAEVLVQNRQLARAAAVTRKALGIFTLHYGNQHPTVDELGDLQRLIRTL